MYIHFPLICDCHSHLKILTLELKKSLSLIKFNWPAFLHCLLSLLKENLCLPHVCVKVSSYDFSWKYYHFNFYD